MTSSDTKRVTLHLPFQLYPSSDASTFDAFGRILSGVARVGQKVKVLGEGYSPMDEEDLTEQVVSHLWIFEARYRVEISTASAGSWVLIGGVDASIMKTATIVESLPSDEDLYICRPLNFPTKSVMKVRVSFAVSLCPPQFGSMLFSCRLLSSL